MRKIEEFEDKIIRVYNVFSEQHHKKIKQIIEQISFKKKHSSDYQCSYIRLKDELYQKLYTLLESYLQHINIEEVIGNHLGEKVAMSGMSEIVKIEKNDFLETHIDDYNMYQAVIHMNSPESERGGELCIKDHTISPEENSIIIFPGKTPHSVKKYTGDTARFSISLGFVRV